MRDRRFPSPRSVWRRVHLWIALGVGILVAPIGLTGTLLVVHDELDRLIDPAIHAVTGADPIRAPGFYIANALAAVPESVVARVRFPAPGAPVAVLLRGSGAGEIPRIAYLDPPTGEVLGVREFRGTFVGLVHSLHGNLLLPGFNGRAIVGWAGFGLFFSALTGVLLWWPRRHGFIRGLSWRRGNATSVNLHNMLGAWICIPLGVVAGTGMTLAFPDQARSTIGLFAATTPRPEQTGTPMARPLQTPDIVAALALAEFDGARLVSLTVPTERARNWRVQVGFGEEQRAVTVDDATGKVALLPADLPGDLFATTLRRLHEGDHNGRVWRAIVFVTGLAPLVSLVTGLVMWRRRVKSTELRSLGLHEEVAFRGGKEQDAAA
jgi:uncharacterized iron-regulated membrane protein